MALKIEMKQLKNEALQVQLKSIHAKLQETKKQMVDWPPLSLYYKLIVSRTRNSIQRNVGSSTRSAWRS